MLDECVGMWFPFRSSFIHILPLLLLRSFIQFYFRFFSLNVYSKWLDSLNSLVSFSFLRILLLIPKAIHFNNNSIFLLLIQKIFIKSFLCVSECVCGSISILWCGWFFFCFIYFDLFLLCFLNFCGIDFILFSLVSWNNICFVVAVGIVYVILRLLLLLCGTVLTVEQLWFSFIHCDVADDWW